MKRLSRRSFLKKAAGTAFIAGSQVFLPSAAFARADFPTVSVAQGSSDDSTEKILSTALGGVGGLARFVKPGMTVAIKPNATWAYPPHTASSTDPELLITLINLVRQAGAAKIIVMDHCSIDPGTAECLRMNGIGKALEKMDVIQIFPDRFNGDKKSFTKIDLAHGKAFQKLGVLKAAVDADLRINMAVAKTHNVTKLTMCLKHMMGFLELPGSLHTNLQQGIADLNTPSPIQAQLHILEAIRVRMPYGSYRVCAGPETDLTNPEIVQRKNQILVGADPVLIDSYACDQYYASDPSELAYIQLAYNAGVGEMDLAKARQQNLLQEIIVGQPPTPIPPSPTPTTILTLTSTPPATVNASTPDPAPTPSATLTQIPGTPTPKIIQNTGPVASPALPINSAAPSSTCNDLVNPSTFLNSALIPAAAVVAGLGLVISRRVARPLKRAENDEKSS